MCEETQFALACFKLIHLKELKKVKKFDLKLIHTLLLLTQVTLIRSLSLKNTRLESNIYLELFWQNADDCLHFRFFSYAEELGHVPVIVKIVSFPLRSFRINSAFF